MAVEIILENYEYNMAVGVSKARQKASGNLKDKAGYDSTTAASEKDINEAGPTEYAVAKYFGILRESKLNAPETLWKFVLTQLHENWKAKQ